MHIANYFSNLHGQRTVHEPKTKVFSSQVEKFRSEEYWGIHDHKINHRDDSDTYIRSIT